ncbi:carbamoyltransferase HypF [Legionella londiniensis]|uniref:Carbamoyltransferase HypF n=1 Tax=Legionella londiniensis TaxID=45068 RepID=A0A0W0VT29_9GAMM|nr:carbamoyltransferase HypF [Legionella londiniensis]KTD23226.1 hydrogenase maturation protein HypF [Legionella londiniensis]STX93763.1 hydrogenase maturation protein HypF [Legionella londiniensis]
MAVEALQTGERLQILITGVVQGVGFRPHVYRVAQELGLTGWVRNNQKGVLIEIQGEARHEFVLRLKDALPPLARIQDIKVGAIPYIQDESGFSIQESVGGKASTLISPDAAICKACLQDLFTPQSRYYLYPFLNCTQCGPRYTLVEKLPYDRARTAMAEFPLCEGCRHDYGEPSNRRYHAQPTACPHCGPELSHSIAELAQALSAGKILAVKGIGGYQFIADARNEETIRRLRTQKMRYHKPLAVMVLNLNSAKKLVRVDAEASGLLSARARPIVLLDKLAELLPEEIAPKLNQYGVMLPSTPFHYLLFHALSSYPEGIAWLGKFHPWVLVVSSANQGGEPIIIDEDKAKLGLEGVADIIVSYNRRIMTRADDSVVRLINNKPRFIRRARGFVPEPIQLPEVMPPTLALGGHLKNTFCLTRGDEAFVSQHIGSLNNRESIAFFHETLNHLQNLLSIRIERLACDLHPDFYTTHLARDFELPCIPVQHHHAHLAAVAAEHHLSGPALGLALDGYGYGTDGHAWGGELLLLENTEFKRLASFFPQALPGGDIASREPWRMAAAVLHQLGRNDEISTRFASMPQAGLLAHWLKQHARGSGFTTSCGRLFDAASALLGVTLVSTYEGQAAMELESLVRELEVLKEGWQLQNDCFNMLPLFNDLLKLDAVQGANLFHGTLIAGLQEWVLYWALKIKVNTILLSGGCFLNRILAEGLSQGLRTEGLEVFLPQKVPANDGGLSLGQAWIAGRKTD